MEALHDAVVAKLGDPEEWNEWPGGWTTEISTALIDAVYSARAQYTTTNGRGIKPLVDAWRAGPTMAKNSISALVAEIDDAGGPDAWKVRMNDQLAPGRRSTDPGGRSKAAAVREAAGNLKDVGIESADDAVAQGEAGRRALLRVSGIGYATTNYFTMLLGSEDVKTDRMIHAFVKEAVGDTMSNARAREAVVKVAADLGVSPTALDHAIWSWQRSHRAR